MRCLSSPLALVAAFLGASSTAWLAQQRAWPAAGERTVLVRSLLGLTVGLVVVWMLPNVAGPLALACCLPLLLLDASSSQSRTIPTAGQWRGGLDEPLLARGAASLQLEQRALPRG